MTYAIWNMKESIKGLKVIKDSALVLGAILVIGVPSYIGWSWSDRMTIGNYEYNVIIKLQTNKCPDVLLQSARSNEVTYQEYRSFKHACLKADSQKLLEQIKR